MWKAFEGANGWYVAWEDKEGFHHQGSSILTEGVARKRARELNEEEEFQESEPVWHVVTGQGNVILGVFGSALLSMAQECARKVERETGLHARVRQVTGAKPRVGTVYVSLSDSNWLAADAV